MKKAFTKVSTSILVILLTVMMLFNVATDAVGGGVQAAGYIKKLTGVDTNYKSFINGDVAFELPSTSRTKLCASSPSFSFAWLHVAACQCLSAL